MDKLFEYLPIIIGILYFLFSGSKKKKQKNAPKKNSAPDNNPWSEIKEQMEEAFNMGQPKKQQPNVPAPQIPDLYSEESEEIKEKKSIEEVAAQAEKEFQQQQESLEEAIKEARQKMKGTSLAGFKKKKAYKLNPKKAIIQSAILNRPYD